MRSRVPAFGLALAAAAFGFSVAAAQTASPAPAARPPSGGAAFKNLQVLPKDIDRQQLLSTMRFFSQSLGVRCTFCHVGAEGQPPSTYDFASDAKKEKLIARKMLTMVQRINTQDLGLQAGMGNAKVTCFTCHRGSMKPLTMPPAADRPRSPQTNPALPPLVPGGPAAS
jgi:hypothetical protein